MSRCGRAAPAKFGTRAEIKNLNSFRFVEKAIQYEVARQIELIESGGKVVQETRLYDSDKHETRSMRSKEEANDYRYFPDPDLLPVEIDEAFIDAVRGTLPELPDEKAARFARDFGLSAYDAGVLSREPRARAPISRRWSARLGAAHAKLAANWVMGELSSALNRDNVEIAESRVSPRALAGLLARIVDATISGKIAKDVFEAMWSDGKSADAIIEAKGLKQITDSGAIEGVIDAVIAANPKQLADYRSGKDKLFGFFVGQVDEGDGRQGESRAAQRAAEDEAGSGQAERFDRLCMTATACIASCSSTTRSADIWCISMPPGGR